MLVTLAHLTSSLPRSSWKGTFSSSLGGKSSRGSTSHLRSVTAVSLLWLPGRQAKVRQRHGGFLVCLASPELQLPGRPAVSTASGGEHGGCSGSPSSGSQQGDGCPLSSPYGLPVHRHPKATGKPSNNSVSTSDPDSISSC